MKKGWGVAVTLASLIAADASAAVPLRTVVANGEPTPGVPNGRFRRPTAASISPSGRVAFVSGIGDDATGDQGRGIWVEGNAGLTFVARLQGDAPGGGTFESFSGAPTSYGDWVVFPATVSGTTALFAQDGPTLRAIAREGDMVGGRAVGTLAGGILTNAKADSLVVDGNGVAFDFPRTGPGGFVIDEVGSPLLSDEGHVALVSTTGGSEPAVRFGTFASLSVVATRKQVGPGMVGGETFASFGQLALGNDGFLVMVGSAFDEGTSQGWTGLFTKSVNGDLSLVSKLPITAGTAVVEEIERIDAAFGSVYLLRGFTAPDGMGNRKVALVVRRADAFVPIAVQGEPAPGAGGATYGDLSSAYIAKNGSVVFATTLEGAGVSPENATAVYMLTSPTAAAPEIVVRAGTPVDLGGSRGTVTPTVVGITPMTGRGGPRGFNDAGEAVIGIRYPFEGSDGNALLVTGSETVEVAEPDLALEAVSVDPGIDENLPAGEFLIRVVVSNVGNDLATDVRVELAGEAGKKLTVLAGDGAWTCASDCRALALRPGEKHEGRVRVASDDPNIVTLTASVPGTVDPTPANNVGTVTLTTSRSVTDGDGNVGPASCSCRVPPARSTGSRALSALAIAAACLAWRRRSASRS